MKVQGIILFIFFFIFVLAFGIGLLGHTGGTVLVLLYVMGGIAIGIINGFNKIKKDQMKVTEARANIGVYLQQRYDEITAIYKIVQEYKLHETDTFKEIIQLRQTSANQQLSFKEKTDIHNQAEEKMTALMATFENYPELRSNENFRQLQVSIKENEENISSSRAIYNSYVNRYNTTISIFPTVLFANILRFTKEDLYEVPKEKMENPLL